MQRSKKSSITHMHLCHTIRGYDLRYPPDHKQQEHQHSQIEHEKHGVFINTCSSRSILLSPKGSAVVSRDFTARIVSTVVKWRDEHFREHPVRPFILPFGIDERLRIPYETSHNTLQHFSSEQGAHPALFPVCARETQLPQREDSVAVCTINTRRIILFTLR